MLKRKRRKRKGRYHTGIYESIKAGSIRYRSQWECEFAKYLDSNSDILSYEYEKLKIQYVSNNKTLKIRNYIPDFLVTYSDNSKVLYEIKPLYKVEKLINRKKFSAARLWCVQNNVRFEILTEVELKFLNVLK